MTYISGSQLLYIMPHLRQEAALLYIGSLNKAMEKWYINTPNRQAAFLALVAWESRELRKWRSERSGWEWEGMGEVGNVYPGDGPKYKEGGPLPIVGRALYRKAGLGIGVGEELERLPSAITNPTIGFMVAGWYWNKLGLSKHADTGDLMGLVKIIIALKGREKIKGKGLLIYWNRAKRALGLTPRV